MKKLGLLLIISVFVVVTFSQLKIVKTTNNHPTKTTKVEMPENIKTIIDKSCYGCHSADGKSDKAKKALRWDTMSEYDSTKLISIMDEIIEVIEKQEMPPEKFLSFKPDAKPTEEEYSALLEWAEQEAEKLLE